MKQKLKLFLLKMGKSIAVLLLVFLLLHLIFPLRVSVEYAPVILAKDGTVLHTWVTKDEQWRMFSSLEEITPELKRAIVFKEDKRFYHHFGIDILSIGRAIGSNVFHFKRTSGASTITMQVARMLNRKPRTYWQKCVEMFRAVQLELKYSKAEILQLYMNLLPYGSNIQGVKAASLLYFSKSPDQLSLAEITALSIIPNKPNYRVMGKDNRAIKIERNEWLLKFKEAQLFDTNIINDAIAEPLNAYRHEAPKTAPQLAWRLRRMFPTNNIIRSTIEAKMQIKAEGIAANYVHSLQLQGVYNGAVIVIDNRSQQVLCYIGSTDFEDKKHHGEVDGVAAQRSPGSTLKPILYGLAIDNGLITPKTIVEDVPLNIAGYAPENYDLNFRGNVSIEDALRNSLNIPAVKTLQQLGVSKMTHSMNEAGFTTLNKTKYKLGLSMILGGCEIRLDELSNFYATLSHGGVFRGLKWTANDTSKVVKGKRILSTSASYMITEILKELSRPDLPNMATTANNIPHIAWKTGTSYSRKDAWSIGYNRDYTIGVWLGNFDGQGAAGLSGAATATPLLFQLFNSIDKNKKSDRMLPPSALSSRIVCAKTGKIPQEECSETISDWYIQGVSPTSFCDHLKSIYLSVDEHFSYCTSCLPVNGFKQKKYENISPALAAFYDSRRINYTKIPPHNPQCSRLFDGEAPVITGLQDGMTYIIVDKNQQLQLACQSSSEVQQVYWYINDKFLGATVKDGKILFTPADTHLKISCTDDKGRSKSIEVKMKFI